MLRIANSMGLPVKPPDLSDRTWIGSAIAVGGAVAAVLGIAVLFWRDVTTLLAIGMGSSLTLAIGLMVINAWQRKRIADLELLYAEERRLARDMADTAKAVSSATDAVIRLGVVASPPAPRRKSAPKKSKG